MNSHAEFPTLSLQVLSPLIADFGYHVAASADDYLRLESSNALVQAYYDCSRAYDVSLEFGPNPIQRTPSGIPFNLGEVFREFGVPDASRNSFFQSTDLVQVEEFLSKACALLLAYCRPLLLGDDATFAALSKRRNIEAAEYTLQLEFDAARREAEIAWHSKKYVEFVNLLNQPCFSTRLTDSEKLKLVYASKQLQVH